jgi:hypothetical protein
MGKWEKDSEREKGNVGRVMVEGEWRKGERGREGWREEQEGEAGRGDDGRIHLLNV